MIESICSNCGSKKVFDDDKAGKKFKCPTCETVVVIEKIDIDASMEKEVKFEVDNSGKIKKYDDERGTLGLRFIIVILIYIFFLLAAIFKEGHLTFKIIFFIVSAIGIYLYFWKRKKDLNDKYNI